MDALLVEGDLNPQLPGSYTVPGSTCPRSGGECVPRPLSESQSSHLLYIDPYVLKAQGCVAKTVKNP